MVDLGGFILEHFFIYMNPPFWYWFLHFFVTCHLSSKYHLLVIPSSPLGDDVINVQPPSTGCKIVSAKKYLLHIQAKKHVWSWARCLFSTYTGTFWYMLSKKFYNYWLIIHFKSFVGALKWKFAKIHWNLMILKCRYYFANISTSKAPIFMKFET